MKICPMPSIVPPVLCNKCQHNINNHQFEDEPEWQHPPVKDDKCDEYKEIKKND